MSNYCKKCGLYMYNFMGYHQCPPQWECYSQEDGDPDDLRRFYANDAEDAATKFFKREDADYDYPDSLTICVRKVGTDEWETLEMEAETTRTYHNVTKR